MALKLVSRSQWGARAYRTPGGATLYSGKRRGIKLHYLGTPYSDRPHTQCSAYIRQIQAQHMDGNGWSDIGYSFAVCTHGSVYEGRGLRRRNSANGSTSLNEQDYAILLLVGSSGLTKPTDVQLDGARDAIDYVRREGPAGTWLGGHRDGYATSCPGDAVYAWAKKGALRPSASTTIPPKEDDVSLTSTQAKQLADLHKTLVPYAGWGYKGSNEKVDAYGYLRGTKADIAKLATQVTALTAAVNKLAQLAGSDVDTEQVVAAVEKAIADAVVKVDVDITSTPIQES
ncbi:peptidoglycan recognition family protein [Streptomyces sp. NPDC059459]|uniref:peptidoglycan recognition protein family protein n=1 Tax=Streptomyces sp. NPDC059459 TaxID=3346839 RepID=UPI003673BA49